ncbi:MAG: DUF1501 domain-containing protein [Acidobacteria bacterium]|jgi:uncharacterized protein (DUF1501 family)|nr:DUF1501 domain-containing protein [Acidobacteriota bacterium]
MMTRRTFFKNGSLALVSLGFAPAFFTRAAQAARAKRKVLVTVFQRGAVDGLNMIVPFGEAEYYKARPSIAIAKPGQNGGALDLDGFFGLHPRMASLEPFFKRGELAIVTATGSNDPTRSHFDAQDYMESGTPGRKSTREGWLNRYLHAREHEEASTFRAVSLTKQLPRALQGPAPALAIDQLDRFGLRAGDRGDSMESSFEAQYAAAADSLLKPTGSEAFEAVKQLRSVDLTKYAPANGAIYPNSGYGQALKQIAQLIKADMGLEVAFAESGQWDHHANETPQLANRLDDFSSGIAAFAQDLGDKMADVMVLTMSEFGRTVAENGARGTDHGHGNSMLLLGGGVNGGKVYGTWPGLAREQRYQNRDLAITTDFRDVFSEVLQKHMGAIDISNVFPDYAGGKTLGLIK